MQVIFSNVKYGRIKGCLQSCYGHKAGKHFSDYGRTICAVLQYKRMQWTSCKRQNYQTNRTVIFQTCQRWRAVSKLTRNVSFPSPCGRFTVTSITPSTGCVSPASHHSCHPNIMDFDEMPPTGLGRGTGAVRGHTHTVHVHVNYLLLLLHFTLQTLKLFKFMFMNLWDILWRGQITCHPQFSVSSAGNSLKTPEGAEQEGFGWCWWDSPHLRADLGVNMRIPTLDRVSIQSNLRDPMKNRPPR